jgi:peptidylprolyl isomerase
MDGRHPKPVAASVAAVLAISTCLVAVSGCNSDTRDPASPQSTSGSAASAGVTPAGTPTAASQGFAGPDAYDAPAVSRYELPSGLVIEDLIRGDGDLVLPMSTVTFHYRFKVKGGDEIHISAEMPHDPPVEGQAPAAPAPESQRLSRLIPGLRDGLVGMKAGGRRRLTIPPDLAPGIAGNRNEAGEFRIAPDAVLIYVVDMIETKVVAPPATPPAAPASPPAGAAPSEPSPR